ncbi:MAG: hypothetical protein ACYC36_06195 [Bellilinea sp.]
MNTDSATAVNTMHTHDEFMRMRDRVEKAEAELAEIKAGLSDPEVVHLNILRGQIALPDYYVRTTDSNGLVAKLEAELAALREQTRWTPISEMLPEVIEQVLCYAPHYHSIEVRWTDQLGEAVTHWRPLPEPPEGA